MLPRPEPTGRLAPARGRYCHDPEASIWLEGLVSRTVELVLQRFGEKQVQAILLLGSLARGEGTVYRDRGRFVLLGDLEFFVVLRPPCNIREARIICRELSGRASAFLGTTSSQVDVDLCPTTVNSLGRSGDHRTIFAYDLQVNPSCCWGDAGVLQVSPPPDRSWISREDAVRLVSNRIVELESCTGGETLKEAYWRAKVLLDLAGSLLAFSGCYESSYERREDALRQLVERHDSLAWAAEPSGLLEKVLWATRCKLDPSPALLTDAVLSPTTAQVQSWARLTWEWEIRSWLGGSPGESTPELVSRFKSRESLRARVRGWLKFAVHPLKPVNALGASRMLRLLPQASPQTLCYASLVLYSAGMHERREDWKRQALEWAPVETSADEEKRDHFGRLADTWHWLLKHD